MRLEYVELSIWLNKFEMFVSNLIHEKNIEKFTILEEDSVKRNHVNRESKILDITI